MSEKKPEKKEDEKGGEKKGEEGAAPPKSKKKLFIIVGAVLVLILGAGVPMFLMGGEKPKEGEEKHEEEHHEKHLETAPMDVFIVNLSETGAFLKVKMLLEYDGEIIAKAAHAGGEGGGGHEGGEGAKKGLPGYLGVREPMIRDAVIRGLSAKKTTDVLSQDGKEKLKEELIETINEAIALEEGPVQQIYFTEFIIQ